MKIYGQYMSSDYNSFKANVFHPIIMVTSRGDSNCLEYILDKFSSITWVMKACEVAAMAGNALVLEMLLEFTKNTYNNLYAMKMPLVLAARKNHSQVCSLYRKIYRFSKSQVYLLY